MGPESVVLSSSKALDGIHGVHAKPYPPFFLEPIPQDGEPFQPEWESPAYATTELPHDSQCRDRTAAETVANVMTSIPFIALGFQAPRKNLNCKLYANSLIGVGVASSLYHSSRGRLRKYLRWLDYTMIAASIVCLSRALRNENPKMLLAASALCLPFQPMMVSAVHTGMMEVSFAQRVLENPNLTTAHNIHKASSFVSGALFVADDVFPGTPFLHAAWHLAAAIGVGTCNKLLE